MDEVEKVAKRLFGRERNRYDYYSLSLDVRDSLLFGDEIVRGSFREQVRKIIFKEDEENDENR